MCRIYHKKGQGYYLRHCSESKAPKGNRTVMYLDKPAPTRLCCDRGPDVARKWDEIRGERLQEVR